MNRTLRNLRAAREEFAAAVRWYEEQIVYRLTPTEIVIVAVAHLKLRPNY